MSDHISDNPQFELFRGRKMLFLQVCVQLMSLGNNIQAILAAATFKCSGLFRKVSTLDTHVQVSHKCISLRTIREQ